MAPIRLPTRRDEAWRWSDLRAAYGAEMPVPEAKEDDAGKPVIVQLAAATGGLERVDLDPGERAFRLERMDAAGFEAKAIHFEVPSGASLTRCVIQDGQAIALNLARVRLAPGAQFRQFVLAFGAKLARIETYIEVHGEGAEVALNGAYACGPGRHADLTSVVHHKAPNSKTVQLTKGAVKKGGRGVFQGKFLVERAAQKTDANQQHHALLLDEGAEVYAKPELEIYADDVACAHGNTAGSLNEEALFYMRARGIPVDQARALLIEAFLLEAVPEWIPEDARTEAHSRLHAFLRAAS